jgi:hypothetical protein
MVLGEFVARDHIAALAQLHVDVFYQFSGRLVLGQFDLVPFVNSLCI